MEIRDRESRPEHVEMEIVDLRPKDLHIAELRAHLCASAVGALGRRHLRCKGASTPNSIVENLLGQGKAKQQKNNDRISVLPTACAIGAAPCASPWAILKALSRAYLWGMRCRHGGGRAVHTSGCGTDTGAPASETQGLGVGPSWWW